MVSFNEVAGNVLLFILVLGMSATVDMHLLAVQLRNIKAIAMGILLQFGVLPLCGFLVVRFLNLDRSVAITLLVVTCSPGGSYSNWFCSTFNADLALSVIMTAISTLLSVFLMPMNLLVYSKYAFKNDANVVNENNDNGDASDAAEDQNTNNSAVVQSIDFIALFISLSVVISAIGLGLLASAKVHSYKFNIMANRMGNYAGLCLVGYSIFMSNTGGQTSMWEHPWQFYVGVSLPCLAGLIIGNILSSFLSLKKPERVTLAVECCYQNVGIAMSVALTMFQGDDAASALAVPVFYGLCEIVFLLPYCLLCWKMGWTKAPSNISFWTMISTSYEVLLIEHEKELDKVEVSLPKNEQDTNERINRKGDTLYVKYSMDDDEDDIYQNVNCMCMQLPSGPKQASGYQLPVVEHQMSFDEIGYQMPEVPEQAARV